MATNKENNKPKTREKYKLTKACTILKPSLANDDEKDLLQRPVEEWGANTQTAQRVIEIAKRISEGGSRKSTQEWISKSYEVNARTARAYYSAALRYLLPTNEEEYKNGLIQANIDRLETIVETAMTKKDHKNAINAIKEMNRMLKPDSNNTIEVATNDVAFRIKFGGE